MGKLFRALERGRQEALQSSQSKVWLANLAEKNTKYHVLERSHQALLKDLTREKEKLDRYRKVFNEMDLAAIKKEDIWMLSTAVDQAVAVKKSIKTLQRRVDASRQRMTALEAEIQSLRSFLKSR